MCVLQIGVHVSVFVVVAWCICFMCRIKVPAYNKLITFGRFKVDLVGLKR
jgi:hypothetical protein